MQRTEVSMLLYSSEFNWSSQPWRILKWPSTLPSSAGSWGCCAGGRGPKSLFARARLGRWAFAALRFGRTATVDVGDCTSRWAAAEEELGRDEVASCDGRVSRGAEAAASELAMSTGACEASGLGRGWPEAVLMVSSSVELGSSQQRPCRMGCLCALDGSAVGAGDRCGRARTACSGCLLSVQLKMRTHKLQGERQSL